MKLYNYNAITHVFTGEEEALQDPVVPDSWLVPAYATTVAIPETLESGYLHQFDGLTNSWVAIKDNSGDWFDGNGNHVYAIYPTHDIVGLTRLTRPSSYHVLVDGKWVITQEQLDSQLGELRTIRMATFRESREVALNRIMGIAYNTQNENVRLECKFVRQELLNLPQHISILNAKETLALDAAITAYIASIKVSTTTTGLASVFTGLIF